MTDHIPRLCGNCFKPLAVHRRYEATCDTCMPLVAARAVAEHVRQESQRTDTYWECFK